MASKPEFESYSSGPEFESFSKPEGTKSVKPRPDFGNVRLPSYGYDPMDKRLSGYGREIVDESKRQVLGDAGENPSARGQMYIDAYARGVSAQHDVLPGDVMQPEEWYDKAAVSGLNAFGMMTDVLGAAAVGVPPAVSFTAYGALQPADSLQERGKNALKNLMLDRLLRYTPEVIKRGAGKAVESAIGGTKGAVAAREATEAAIERGLSHPLGRLGYTGAVVNALGAAEGHDPREYWAENLGATLGLTAAHPYGGRGTREPKPSDVLRADEVARLEYESTPPTAREVNEFRARMGTELPNVDPVGTIRGVADGSLRRMFEQLPGDGTRLENIPAPPRQEMAMERPQIPERSSVDVVPAGPRRMPTERPEVVEEAFNRATDAAPLLLNPATTALVPTGRSRPDPALVKAAQKEISEGSQRKPMQQASGTGMGKVMQDRNYGPVLDEPPAPRRGDVNLNAFGGQDLYEFARDIAKRGYDTAKKLGIDGVAKFLNGEIDAPAYAEWVRKNGGRLPGNVTERHLDDAVVLYLTGKKASKLDAAVGNGKMSRDQADAEMSAYSDNIIDQVANGKLRGMRDNKEVVELAQWEALPKDVRDQLLGGGIGDIDPRSLNWKDRRRYLQAVGGGRGNSPILDMTQRMSELLELANKKITEEYRAKSLNILEGAGIKANSNDSRAVGQMLDTWDRSMSISDWAAPGRPGNKILASADNPNAVIKATKGVDAVLEELYQIQNAGRVATGESEMPRRDPYYPKVEKDYGWGQPGKKIEKATRPRPGGVDRAGGRRRLFNPHELHRTDRPYEREWDVYKVLDKYIPSAARSMSSRIGIQSGKAVADGLERVGAEKSAQGVRQLTDATFNGQAYGLDHALRNLMGSNRAGRAIEEISKVGKSNFNKAKYTFNLPFMVLTQPSSIALTQAYANVSPKMMAEAWLDMWSPAVGELYKSTYVGKMKSLEYGSMTREASGVDILASDTMVPQSAMRRGLRRASEKPVNFVEEMTGRFSVSIALRLAQAKNLTGVEAHNFVSDFIAKTQSEYHNTARAGVLKNPTLNFFNPAQSFGIEGMNAIVEAFSDGSGVKTWSTPKQSAAAATRVLTTMIAFQMVKELVTGHEDELGTIANATGNASLSLVPYGPNLMGLGPGTGKAYPAAMIEDMGKAWQYAWNGDMASAFGEVADNVLRGGAAMNRAISANRMIDRGILKESERAQASAMGWWTVPSGKEYLRKIKNMNSDKPAPPGVIRRTRPRSASPARNSPKRRRL